MTLVSPIKELFAIMEYRIIKSNRKTLALEVQRDGRLIIRAPFFATDEQIRRFVALHREWGDKQISLAKARNEAAESLPPLTAEDLRALADRASRVIPERVRYFAPLIGVNYGRITIRNQRTKWGSCSAKGNLNFNCLLMLAPPEVVDSIVVHELCHLKEMNHSARFYQEVLRVFPDYKKWNRWLKENGSLLMQRMR